LGSVRDFRVNPDHLMMAKHSQQREAMESILAAHETLKARVREQELELQELRSALMEKASEADMVLSLGTLLHSIGNAMTPVKVYIEKLDLRRLELMSYYLEKSFLELAEHREDLQHFIDEDERGRSVFSYLAKLVPSIRECVAERVTMLDKATTGVDRVVEILGVQQRMGSSGREAIDLNQLIQDVVLVQTGSLCKRGIAVRLELGPHLPSVFAERSGLMHVLINVFRSCCEALNKASWEEPREKEIVVITRVEEHQVKIEIVHNGPGMCDRNEAAQRTEASGGALGGVLNDSCMSVLSANGGAIILTSEAEGQPASISIAFPRVASVL
jgi:two-component system, NtrC family, sensor kinase